jgi:hypothetical protein
VTRHVEIILAPRGQAVIETYLDGRRTHMSEPLPRVIARARAAAKGWLVIDHIMGNS